MNRDFTVSCNLDGLSIAVTTDLVHSLVTISLTPPGGPTVSVSLPPQFSSGSSSASSAASDPVAEVAEVGVGPHILVPLAAPGPLPSGLHLTTVASRDRVPVFLTGTQRVLAAFIAGQHARDTIAGLPLQVPPSRPRLALQVFVVLRDRNGWQYDPAWISFRRAEVWSAVADDEVIHALSVWHGFPSETEARAYVQGSEFQWPTRA